MAPYPTELRPRVGAAVEQGDMTIGEVARIFNVGVTFVKKMLRLSRGGEDLAPRQGGGSAPTLSAPERALRRDTVALAPKVTLAECQTMLREHGRKGGRVPTICRALQQRERPRKKSLAASEREEKARPKFRKLTGALEVSKSIFIDEMGSNLGLPRLYGRATPGQRVPDAGPGDRGGNLSTIGALGLDGVHTGLSVPGAMDGETRLCFVEELLGPTLKRGDIGGMDNNPSHKLDEIEAASEAAGAWVLFLPTYAPDRNPIETCWSKGKSILRSLKPRTVPDFLEALTPAFASITLPDILSWFRHCGSRVAST